MYDEVPAVTAAVAVAGPAEANSSAALPADEAADSRRSIIGAVIVGAVGAAGAGAVAAVTAG